ncbi:MAG: hypothetical protein JSU77_07245 [Fidelibacterota bacterium]|nr:MAG: hypothetical protein JSU77_07245 [Candidatus Neomarinimicrobiota bacterium]
MRFAAVYVIIVGMFMTGWWTFILAIGQVPELETEPIRLAFHLAAEFLTAILLIVGGILLLRNSRRGTQLTLLALGMLLYTVIASPGYFGQQGQWPMVILFIVLLALAVGSVAAVLCPRPGKGNS